MSPIFGRNLTDRVQANGTDYFDDRNQILLSELVSV